MATWMTHLRVADRLYNRLKISDDALYFTGCIAPDANEPPDKTHWCVNGDKTTCNKNADADRQTKAVIEQFIDEVTEWIDEKLKANGYC